MNTPEVTIVVPVYNGAAYLRETLDSLLSQTFRNFELLAIDDGSKDNSAEIVRSMHDDRIRLIQKPNAGLCETLNRGIEEARAPFVARSDQDDLSSPERIERQLNAMHEHPDAIALFGFNTKFGGKREWSNKDKYNMAADSVKTYEPMVDGCLLGSTMLARVDALRSVGGYRKSYYPVDDWDLECRLSQAGRVIVLQEALTAYRFQAEANTYRVFSEMQTKTRWTADSFHRRARGEAELNYEDFLAQEPDNFWLRLARRREESAKWNMRTAGQCFLDARYVAAAGKLSMACLLDPADTCKRVLRMAGLVRS